MATRTRRTRKNAASASSKPSNSFHVARLVRPLLFDWAMRHTPSERIDLLRRKHDLWDIPTAWIEKLDVFYTWFDHAKSTGNLKEAGDAKWDFDSQLAEMERYRRRFHKKRGERLLNVVHRAMWGAMGPKGIPQGIWKDMVQLVTWDARWIFEPWFKRQVVSRLLVEGANARQLEDLSTAMRQNRWLAAIKKGNRRDLLQRLNERLKAAGCHSLAELICSKQESAKRKTEAKGKISDGELRFYYPTSVTELLDGVCAMGWADRTLCEDPEYFRKYLKRKGLM